jgi:hypothetical protein
MLSADKLVTGKERIFLKAKVWKILCLLSIALFVLSAANASATPTMSSMAGTYVEQTSSGTGYTIILYANGTGIFSGHVGTWTIMNVTTLEGSYSVLGAPTNSYFTVTNNGFTSVLTGNEYIKTASASASPTTSPAATSAAASPTPSVPEFSNAALALIVTMIAVATCTVAIATKKTKRSINSTE